LLSGSPNGDATVLVHGGVGFTIEWADIAARLDGPVVIPDRPGFGLSDPHDYRQIDFRADAARWLRELTERLGAEQIDLVAGSMGGFSRSRSPPLTPSGCAG
jgi:pimeloyl-ACP methyl ester carboxylesterase